METTEFAVSLDENLAISCPAIIYLFIVFSFYELPP